MGMEQQLLSPAPHALQRDRAALPGNVGMGRRAKVDGLQKNSCRLEGRAGQGVLRGRILLPEVQPGGPQR